MALISIKGVKKAHRRALLRRAAHWFSDRLLGDRLSPNITIDIYFNYISQKEEDGGILLAYCEYMGNAVRPRDFEIHIGRGMPLREQLKALVHELVHVKQYSRGELYDYQRDYQKSRWHKQIVIRNDNVSMARYKNYPWEKEAYQAETPMLTMFLKENGIDLRSRK